MPDTMDDGGCISYLHEKKLTEFEITALIIIKFRCVRYVKLRRSERISRRAASNTPDIVAVKLGIPAKGFWKQFQIQK